MNTERTQTPERQQSLLQRWIHSLQQLPAVEVIWLEGSLVDDRANPWSDIDLRVAIVDEAHPHLWGADRLALLKGIGEYLLLLNGGWLRALTAEGVVVELLAYKASEVDRLELYEWRILFNRLPEPRPSFRKVSERSTAETWPAPEWSSQEVSQWTKEVLHLLAATPQDFYRREECAAAYQLDYLRNGLFRLMYQRLGIRFSKRAKELSEIFPPEFMTDLKSTYTREGESALDPAAIAAAQIRTFAALGKHLEALSDQVGGGFEPEWFERLFERTKKDLDALVRR